VHKRDHFHDKRCASCWHSVEDDDHISTCMERKSQQNWLLCYNEVPLIGGIFKCMRVTQIFYSTYPWQFYTFQIMSRDR
jgi:hypothetical protein